jgi:hypothetical protein
MDVRNGDGRRLIQELTMLTFRTNLLYRPHHTVVRSGHRFTIRHDKALLVEVFLFHLLKVRKEARCMRAICKPQFSASPVPSLLLLS